MAPASRSELPLFLQELPASPAQPFLIGLKAIQHSAVAVVDDFTAKPFRIAAARPFTAVTRIALSEAQRRNQANQHPYDQGSFQHFLFPPGVGLMARPHDGGALRIVRILSSFRGKAPRVQPQFGPVQDVPSLSHQEIRLRQPASRRKPRDLRAQFRRNGGSRGCCQAAKSTVGWHITCFVARGGAEHSDTVALGSTASSFPCAAIRQ
jgi:hypothetical protein